MTTRFRKLMDDDEDASGDERGICDIMLELSEYRQLNLRLGLRLFM